MIPSGITPTRDAVGETPLVLDDIWDTSAFSPYLWGMVSELSPRRRGLGRGGAAAGDAVAFARIVGAHHDDMARVCCVVCGDLELAQDAVQAAWPIAWRRLDTLRDPERLRGVHGHHPAIGSVHDRAGRHGGDPADAQRQPHCTKPQWNGQRTTVDAAFLDTGSASDPVVRWTAPPGPGAGDGVHHRARDDAGPCGRLRDRRPGTHARLRSDALRGVGPEDGTKWPERAS